MNAWLIEAGLLDIEHGDPIGLVVETGCRYAAPLSYPEPVEVGLAVEHLGRSSVRDPQLRHRRFASVGR